MLADWRKQAKCGAHLVRHMCKLPAYLGLSGFRPIWSCERGCFDGICRCAQRMRPHVADRRGLAGCSSRGRGCWGRRFAGGTATAETSAYFQRSIQLSASERPGPSNSGMRAVIIWALGVEQPQNPRGTIGSPFSDQAPIGLA